MRSSTLRGIGITIGILVILLLIAGRLYLNVWLLHYVNHTLNNIKGFEGAVQDISVDLYRGAYRIHNLKLYKKDGNIPTPFIAIRQTDLSLQWKSLFHGRIVSSIDLQEPVVNFAVNGEQKQVGNEVDWTRPIKKLMPIDINIVTFEDGRVTYQDFSSHPQVNIFIHHMQGDIQNLRNVVEASKPLPSSVYVKGDTIGGGSLVIKGRMNILKPVPDMDLETQLENVHLPALNSYSDAYGNFDFKDGEFDLYSEFIVKDKQVSGYIKPIARHVSILGAQVNGNPVKLAWESIVAGITELFTNHVHDQFATKIPLDGSLDHVQTDIWPTITGIFHNAFVDALKKGLDENGKSDLLKKSE